MGLDRPAAAHSNRMREAGWLGGVCVYICCFLLSALALLMSNVLNVRLTIKIYSACSSKFG